MKILLDKDGVMYDLHTVWSDRHNNDYGHIHTITVDDITSWSQWKACIDHQCGVEPEQYFLDPSLWIEGLPIEGSVGITKDWINSGHDIAVITTVANSIATKPSWDWINIYFPHIPNIMMVTGHIKHWAVADVLIDDGLHNHKDFRGISILFDRPWNRNDTTLIRARDWYHVDTIVKRADELINAYRLDMELTPKSLMAHKWIESRLKREVEEGL